MAILRALTETVRLTIDGQAVTASGGASVTQAAQALGNPIPSLCATDTDALRAFGSCIAHLTNGAGGLSAVAAAGVARLRDETPAQAAK